MAMLEARPYRPFKSSEEYLEAMKEDLAEWLSTLYPELLINAENFMDRLDTGVALCKHANNVRQAAEDYLVRRQARNKSMTRSMTSGLAGPILAMGSVHYLPAAKSGTFFSRDNVSNFITWCRKSLKIIECLLFETDDLIMRKNEKHVILCLLEVARRGAKFGMLAPMLVQMERQIDREIAADNKANGIGCGTQTDGSSMAGTQTDSGVGTERDAATDADMFDTDSEIDGEDDEDPVLMYGPQPQIITNDLKSLDEMVRDLVEKCTCPSQFPMIRVSEGKYRIGDTKVLIFVRILRSHVMVRVGGGWDTLSHYLDKHDPCRCKAQHRAAVAARLVTRHSSGGSNQSNGIELHKAQVIYERSPPSARKIISNYNSQPSGASSPPTASPGTNSLSPSAAGGKLLRSSTPQRKFLNQPLHLNGGLNTSPDGATPSNGASPSTSTSPSYARRSMSPSPRRLIDMRKKHNSLDAYNNSGPKSMPLTVTASDSVANHHVQFEAMPEVTSSSSASSSNGGNSKFENVSDDNGSEISDEGYRSLGVIQSTNGVQKRESVHSQASIEEADINARFDQTSSDSQVTPNEEPTVLPSAKLTELLDGEDDSGTLIDTISGPQSLPAILLAPTSPAANSFEQSGIFITDDEITVDIASSTGLRKTGFSNRIFGASADADSTDKQVSMTPSSPVAQRRRRSIDNSRCGNSGSLQDLSARTGLPVFNRAKPVYRSVRKSAEIPRKPTDVGAPAKQKAAASVGREVTNTWSGRSSGSARKRPTIGADTFTSSPATGSAAGAFERNSRTRSSHILYDSNGRRIKGCTASLTTSPVKNHASSPLAQQLLEAASSAKNDAQILEKMKTLLSRYSSSNQTLTAASSSRSPAQRKPVIYDDFTSAWVHSNGNLERSSSCSPPTKTVPKRSSAASSTESTYSRDAATAAIVAPRRERGTSRIPAPISRQHTELY